MKTLFQSALLVGLSLAACSLTQAQTDPPLNEGAIVVLDVAAVFKQNAAFDAKIKAIAAQAEKLKADVEGRQTGLRQEAQNVTENFDVNSPDRKKAEAKLEQDMTALKTYARQAEADLMAQEATVYFETYVEMQKVVEQLAQEFGIAMVLRYDSSPIDVKVRNSVISAVNRAIVYQKDRDLTPHVIARMGPQVSQAPTGVQTK